MSDFQRSRIAQGYCVQLPRDLESRIDRRLSSGSLAGSTFLGWKHRRCDRLPARSQRASRPGEIAFWGNFATTVRHEPNRPAFRIAAILLRNGPMANRLDFPSWLAILFRTTIPSSKVMALPSDFNLSYCRGRFPKEGAWYGLSELQECQRRRTHLQPMRRIGVASRSNHVCLRRRPFACHGLATLRLRRFDRDDVGSKVLPRVQTRRWRNGDCLPRQSSADRRLRGGQSTPP